MTRQLNNRRGFTLVELLVVIGIIGLLAAISVPIVMQALAKARNAAIKAEIDMLHMAIMNYKNEYGSFPPCEGLAAAQKHLQRIFPRCDATSEFSIPPTGQTALVEWLSGYKNNPQFPLTGGGTGNKLFDFDQSRISNLTYHPPGKPGSPYVYIPSSQYRDFENTASTLKVYRAHFIPPKPLPSSLPADQLILFTNLTGSQQFANPDTFQILCAGRDEEFGTDDDLSNFWPGTRREYLDSLKK